MKIRLLTATFWNLGSFHFLDFADPAVRRWLLPPEEAQGHVDVGSLLDRYTGRTDGSNHGLVLGLLPTPSLFFSALSCFSTCTVRRSRRSTT